MGDNDHLGPVKRDQNSVDSTGALLLVFEHTNVDKFKKTKKLSPERDSLFLKKETKKSKD